MKLYEYLGESSSPDNPAYISYFILAGIAITLTSISCIAILQHANLKHISSRLVFWMHFTLLIEEIFTIPYIYSANRFTCSAAAFIHTFSGLANGLVTGCVMVHYYVNFVDQRYAATVNRLMNRMELLIVGFCCITLLPFTTNSYGESFDVWCLIPRHHRTDIYWSFFVYQLWIWLAIVVGLVMVMRAVATACAVKTSMGIHLFGSIGIYGVTAILCWSFRISVGLWSVAYIPEGLSESLSFISQLLIMITGVLFATVLAHDFSALHKLNYAMDDEFQLCWEDEQSLRSSRTNSQVSERTQSTADPFARLLAFG